MRDYHQTRLLNRDDASAQSRHAVGTQFCGSCDEISRGSIEGEFSLSSLFLAADAEERFGSLRCSSLTPAFTEAVCAKM